jgi:hypothetical protein
MTIVHIVGAVRTPYQNSDSFQNNPNQAHENALICLSEILGVKIICYDPLYRKERLSGDIRYFKGFFTFNLANANDIIVDFASLSHTIKIGELNNILYLEPGCQWSQGFPLQLIIKLFNSNIKTISTYDWKNVKTNCEKSFYVVDSNETTRGDISSQDVFKCYIKPQMTILGDFKYLLNIDQKSSLQEYLTSEIRGFIHIKEVLKSDFSKARNDWTNIASSQRTMLREYIYCEST